MALLVLYEGSFGPTHVLLIFPHGSLFPFRYWVPVALHYVFVCVSFLCGFVSFVVIFVVLNLYSADFQVLCLRGVFSPFAFMFIL